MERAHASDFCFFCLITINYDNQSCARFAFNPTALLCLQNRSCVKSLVRLFLWATATRGFCIVMKENWENSSLVIKMTETAWKKLLALDGDEGFLVFVQTDFCVNLNRC